MCHMYESDIIYYLVLLVPKLYINGVTLTVFFSNIFISELWFWDSGILLCRTIVHSLSLLYDILFCECNLFIQSTVDGHSSYCQFYVVTNNTFMNSGFWCTFARICIYLGLNFLVSGICILNFTGKCSTVFQNDCTRAQAVIHEIPLQTHLYQWLATPVFLSVVLLVNM